MKSNFALADAAQYAEYIEDYFIELSTKRVNSSVYKKVCKQPHNVLIYV